MENYVLNANNNPSVLNVFSKPFDFLIYICLILAESGEKNKYIEFCCNTNIFSYLLCGIWLYKLNWVFLLAWYRWIHTHTKDHGDIELINMLNFKCCMILKFYLGYYLKIFEVDNFLWINSLFKLLGLFILHEDEQKVSVGEFDEPK